MGQLAIVLVGGLLSVALGGFQGNPQYALWQADLQIRSLVVTEDGGNLRARVVVAVEAGEALGARVEILLPVGVGIVALGPGCQAGPNATGIRELRGRVECNLGNLPVRTHRELWIETTLPPKGVGRGFGVVVMSDTPDPNPANNFADRMIPEDGQGERPM